MNSTVIPIELSEFLSHLQPFINEETQYELSWAIEIVKKFKRFFLSIKVNSKDFPSILKTFYKFLDFLPSSSEFNKLFNDKEFLTRIFQYNIKIDNLDPLPYLILLKYLRGDFLESKTTITNENNDSFNLYLTAICENNLEFYNNLNVLVSTKPDYVLLMMEYLLHTYYLLSWSRNFEINLIAQPYIRYYRFGIVARKVIFEKKNINAFDSETGNYQEFISSFLKSTYNVFVKYDFQDSNLTALQNSNYFNDFLRSIVKDMIKTFNLRSKSNSEILNYLFSSNLNLKNFNDFKTFILKNFKFKNLLLIKGFQINTQIKPMILKQQLISKNLNNWFPTYKFLIEICNLLNNKLYDNSNPLYEKIKFSYLYIDEVVVILITKCLNYWIKSKANNEIEEDFVQIINLLKMDLQFLNINLLTFNNYNDPLKILKNQLTYGKIKLIQLRFLKDDQFKNNKHFEVYNENLLINVKEFIINQRLNQLIKGIEVYKNNPLTGDKRQAPFLIYLAPKKNYLHYNIDNKEFKILISEIKSLKYDKIGFKSINSNFNFKFLTNKNNINEQTFIKFNSNRIVNKIRLLNKDKKPIIEFYTKSFQDFQIWIDSLNLLINNYDFSSISLKTQDDLKELFDIRRNVQFLPFADIFNNSTIELYTSNRLRGLGNSSLKNENFLTLKYNDFLSVLRETDKDFAKIQNQESNKYNDNLKQIIEEKFLEENDNMDNDGQFEYTYEELIDVAKGFYFN